MELLYAHHNALLSQVQKKFQRDLLLEIQWKERLIALRGARGVGKTTLLLQHINKTFGFRKEALYISMDHLEVSKYSIWEIANQHHFNGGTHLFIDEIHKYQNWSVEIKNIYDRIPGLHVVFTSSSILQIAKGNADLSRRCVIYTLHGLSFREFIQLKTGLVLKKYTLNNLLQNHIEISTELISKYNLQKYFHEYLQYGYYPFFLEGENMYHHKLNNVINLILEVDMPYIFGTDPQTIFKMKKLIQLLGSGVPYKANISKLAGSVELSRNSILQYLFYLEQAEILQLLRASGKFYSQLSKPEKIYLHNPNLCYVVSGISPNLGTLREVFFMNQVQQSYSINNVEYGDFLVENKYTFEIGGSGKLDGQIKNVKNSFLALDNLKIGVSNKIPLWMFGLLN